MVSSHGEMPELITIVGGGLAGLTLGIALRQRDARVTVWEAGHYPRHRVCGEFISGQGQSSLARLGLLERVHEAGACPAITAAFFDGNAVVQARALPQPALCISRFVLDGLLAHEFQRLGGELRAGERWRGEYGPGIVRASGRRAEPVANGWRWFALKVHARGVPLAADLELHFVPAGYVGLCRLAVGEVNVCGLFRSRATVPDLAQIWRAWLAGPVGSVLHSRLAGATLEEASFCSVAALSLRPRAVGYEEECCIGDALTMIPPLAGNGMSMAFEAAELAAEPLARFNQGQLGWEHARRQVARACHRRFTRRLRWAGLLQALLFRPRVRGALLFLAAHTPSLWRGMFAQTR